MQQEHMSYNRAIHSYYAKELTGQNASGISVRTESFSVAFGFMSTFHWSIESIGGTPLAMCRSSVASTPTSVVKVLYPVCDRIEPDSANSIISGRTEAVSAWLTYSHTRG
jgi:hypothetical protein